MTEINTSSTPSDTLLDILITGGHLLTMDDEMAVIEDAVIGILHGKILFIGAKGEPFPPFLARETIDASGCLILPGLINTHTHAPMVVFRGMADDVPLMDWLHKYIFPAEAQYINEDMVYFGALLAASEMILSGTTTFADGYFLEGCVAQAALDAGIRTVAAQGYIDLVHPGDNEIRKHILNAESYVKRWNCVSPLVHAGLFCHSAYACSDRTLRVIKDCATALGVPFFIHLSETREERLLIEDREGMTPVRYLNRLGILDDKTVAVHCVWVDEEEIEILADKGVPVSHTPESNMKLACGIAPVPKMLDHGIVVGLGTDGPASNNNLDLFLEMDTASKVHKAALMDPTVMDAKTVLQISSRGGARLLGMDHLVGSISCGKYADLILVETRRPHLTPLYNPYSQIVYSASGADVRTSIINGKVAMRDRKLLNAKTEMALEKVRELGGKIRKGLKTKE